MTREKDIWCHPITTFVGLDLDLDLERKRHLVSPDYYVYGPHLTLIGCIPLWITGSLQKTSWWCRWYPSSARWYQTFSIRKCENIVTQAAQLITNHSTSNACITQNGSQDPAKSLLQLPSNGGPPCLELCFLTLPLVIEANSDIVTPVIDIFKLKLCCVLLKSGHGRITNFWGWQIPLMEAKRCEKEGEGDANWEFPETPHGFNRFLLRCLFRTFHTLISLVAFEKLSGVPTVCIERGSHQKCKFPEGTLWFENRLLKPKEKAKFTLQKENLKHFEFMLPSFLTTHEMNTSAKQVVAEVRGVAGEKRLNPSSPPRHLEIHLMKPQMKRN